MMMMMMNFESFHVKERKISLLLIACFWLNNSHPHTHKTHHVWSKNIRFFSFFFWSIHLYSIYYIETNSKFHFSFTIYIAAAAAAVDPRDFVAENKTSKKKKILEVYDLFLYCFFAGSLVSFDAWFLQQQKKILDPNLIIMLDHERKREKKHNGIIHI